MTTLHQREQAALRSQAYTRWYMRWLNKLPWRAEKHKARVRPHFHMNEQGLLVACYHTAKPTFPFFKWLFVLTVTFPIEHLMWEHLPPLVKLLAWLNVTLGLH